MGREEQEGDDQAPLQGREEGQGAPPQAQVRY